MYDHYVEGNEMMTTQDALAGSDWIEPYEPFEDDESSGEEPQKVEFAILKEEGVVLGEDGEEQEDSLYSGYQRWVNAYEPNTYWSRITSKEPPERLHIVDHVMRATINLFTNTYRNEPYVYVDPSLPIVTELPT